MGEVTFVTGSFPVTYTNLPFGLIAKSNGAEVVANGDPAISVNAPVVALIWNTLMKPLISEPAKRKRCLGSATTVSAVPPVGFKANGLPGMVVSSPVV